MTFWAVNQELKDINSTAVRNALMNLSNNETFQTFLGPIAYNNSAHTNPYFTFYPMQYIGGGTGKYLHSVSDLIYPAPFPWRHKSMYYFRFFIFILFYLLLFC
jgi:hypothetical protein